MTEHLWRPTRRRLTDTLLAAFFRLSNSGDIARPPVTSTGSGSLVPD
ncbi:hypothetical protein AB0D57_06250 [Streptomyces sp. NPDC048275]